jgi:nitrous oxidase accessory protein
MNLLPHICMMALALAGPVVGQSHDFDLAAAVARAPAGSTVLVPAGVHAGPIVIEKPLTLAGEAGAIIDGGGDGDVIRIEAPDVTVRNLMLRGTGNALHHENAAVRVNAPRASIIDNTIEDALFGILMKGAEESVIRGNTIRGKDLDIARRGDGIRLWQSSGSALENNVVIEGRDVVLWYSTGVTIRGNHVSRSRYGLHFMFTDDNVIEENTLQGNSVGCFLMYSKNITMRRNVFRDNRGPSGYGLGLKDMDSVAASENLFIGNRVGIYFDNSPSSMSIHDSWTGNTIAYNDIGALFMPNVRRNTFAGNSFIDNIEQVAVIGGGALVENSFASAGRGNFWSDYNGYDLDGDGVGDFEYRAESLFENLMDREPKLRLFLFSPVQQAMEMASRAMPAVKPRPKLTDAAPLMRPARIEKSMTAAASPWPMVLLAICFLGMAGVVLWTGRSEQTERPRLFAAQGGLTP